MDEHLPDIRITVEPDPDTFAAEIDMRLSEFSPGIVKARF
jgi:hypothetical protein